MPVPLIVPVVLVAGTAVAATLAIRSRRGREKALPPAADDTEPSKSLPTAKKPARDEVLSTFVTPWATYMVVRAAVAERYPNPAKLKPTQGGFAVLGKLVPLLWDSEFGGVQPGGLVVVGYHRDVRDALASATRKSELGGWFLNPDDGVIEFRRGEFGRGFVLVRAETGEYYVTFKPPDETPSRSTHRDNNQVPWTRSEALAVLEEEVGV